MATRLALLLLAVQAVSCLPAVNERSLDVLKQIKTEVLSTVGEATANKLDVVADISKSFTNKDFPSKIADFGRKSNEKILKLLDLKIEFFLCNVFRVGCPNDNQVATNIVIDADDDQSIVIVTDDENDDGDEDENDGYDDENDDDVEVEGRSGLGSFAMTLEDINSELLREATDELVEDERMFLISQDQKEYMNARIKTMLCNWDYEQFCDDEDSEAGDGDEDDDEDDEDVDEDDEEEDDEDEEAGDEDDAEERSLGRQDLSMEDDDDADDDDVDVDVDVDVDTEASGKKRATITKSLLIRKLFTGFGVKMGFVLCKLRLWCPDEHLDFTHRLQVQVEEE